MELSPNELRALNQQGFLPLEDEEEQAFIKRIEILRTKKTSPFDGEIQALHKCEQLFDARPDWVCIVQTQQGLAPWQGAVLWIEKNAEGVIIPSIQVSPRLTSSWLRHWYSEDEVIAHELVHSFRFPLNSSRFEEIAAYQTSTNPIRRSLGPIIRRPHEVYVLLGVVVLGWLGLLWSTLSFLLWAPWIVCLFGLGRLLLSQLIFRRCQKHLASILKDPAKALSLMVRLSDREVSLFSWLSLKDILLYIRKSELKQLRWKLICASYPFNNQ